MSQQASCRMSCSLAKFLFTMGLQYTNFFDSSDYEASDTQIIICKECSCHLCLLSLIISDLFSGSSGQAYLVDRLINYVADDRVEETQMKTGIYLIKKVRCHQCGTTLGWNYKKLFSYREAYKEGKFVIEKAYIRMIDNNSSTTGLMEEARKSYNRRKSSATLVDDDDFKFSDSNFKYISHLRLQNVTECSEDVLVELEL